MPGPSGTRELRAGVGLLFSVTPPSVPGQQSSSPHAGESRGKERRGAPSTLCFPREAGRWPQDIQLPGEEGCGLVRTTSSQPQAPRKPTRKGAFSQEQK